MSKRTKINKKRPGWAHFFIKKFAYAFCSARPEPSQVREVASEFEFDWETV